MGAAGRRGPAGLALASVLLFFVLYAQGCGGTGAQSGGAVQGRSMPGSAGDVEMAAAQEARVGAVTEGGFDRMVVKTAELGIRTADVRGSAAEAQGVAGRFGGEVLSSRVYAGSGPISADLVLSVPSAEFEAALDGLRGLGDRVTTETIEGQDVTEEFVDLGSRERNLLAAEESLLRLYDRAESVEDTLIVERELADVRGQIEEVQGRIQYLERRTSTSEIVLHIERTVGPSPERPWSAASVASRAWEASLGVLRAGATALISAAVFSWWLLPPVVAGLLWWRRHRAADASG